jgi:DNA-binding NarL/FixJ family response regulator
LRAPVPSVTIRAEVAVTRNSELAVSSPVLVVDDEPDFRSFVATLLERMSLRVVEASTGAEAVAVARRERPALVVADVRLPDINGLELCRELHALLGAELPVILVSGEKVDDLDRSAGLLLGADDYLVKPFQPSHFTGRVRRLVSGSRNGKGHRAPARGPGDRRVTPREREVLVLLAEGLNRSEIAERLVISPRTVGSHIQHMLTKFDVHSQAQMVAAAYREGLIEWPSAPLGASRAI